MMQEKAQIAQNRPGVPVGRAAALPLGLALAACALVRSEGPSINLTMTAGLEDTEAIAIVQLVEPGQEAEQPEQVVALIRQPADIRSIAAALDTSLPLVPAALCLERHRLHFIQPDGEVVTFGYSCNGDRAFLRGDQPYWQGMEVYPPENFQALLSGQLQGPQE